jgi:hypothetical protein
LRRLAWLLAGLAFLVIAVYGIYLSLNASSRTGTVTARRPDEGIVSGFAVRVASVQRDSTDPNLSAPASSRLVKVQLTFQNTSGSQQRADPADFKLRAGAGADHDPAFAASGDCRRWQRADLYPPEGDGRPLRDSDAHRSGPTFGPVTLCFTTPPSDGAMMLIWSPDVGLIGGTVAIPLRGR